LTQRNFAASLVEHSRSAPVAFGYLEALLQYFARSVAEFLVEMRNTWERKSDDPPRERALSNCLNCTRLRGQLVLNL
jgi:hypothetical protein